MAPPRVLFAAVSLASAVAATSPHVVLLVLDDIGWADVGYHGSNFPTPNIDRLASSGAKLERMYVMPQCSPTRAAVMTGRHSFRTGMQHFTTIMPGATPAIPKAEKTIAETFKSAGYATHMIGKWHLGYARWSDTPLGRGFDSSYGYLQGQTDYYNRTIASCATPDQGPCLFPVNKLSRHSLYGEMAEGYDFWDGREPVVEQFGQYTVDAYDARLNHVLQPYGSAQPPSKPLFLYFAHQQLHIPLQTAPEAQHVERCRGIIGGSGAVNRTVMCSMASRMDQSVGLLDELLHKYGMWNDTLIFAVSDNGGMTYWADAFPASASSNHPLRGGKTTVFDGGVRSVSFVNGGALPVAARGATRKQLLHAVDILPTLASFAGVPLLSEADGLDAWATIANGDTVPRTELPINIGVNPLGGLPGWTPGLLNDGALNYSAVIAWPYKVIVGSSYVMYGVQDDRRRDGWWSVDGYRYEEPVDDLVMQYQLYNLEEDEEERHNLAQSHEHQELLQKLLARVKWYAAKENGWVKPQWNVPRQIANPRFHEWTWAPFLWGDEGELAREDVEMSSLDDIPIVV